MFTKSCERLILKLPDTKQTEGQVHTERRLLSVSTQAGGGGREEPRRDQNKVVEKWVCSAAANALNSLAEPLKH